MAYHLLQANRRGAKALAESLNECLASLRHCRRCNDFSSAEVCERCLSPKRDASLLCVVESSIDMNMMEQTAAYQGLYFVLLGKISPLDGVGPRELGLEKLLARAQDGVVQEVILATNFTNEGEATAHYLTSLLQAKSLRVTRIARGVPVGGELEFVDSGTLAQALRERRECAD